MGLRDQLNALAPGRKATLLPASQALELVQPLEDASMAATFASLRADAMAQWLDAAFAVLEAARRNEALTKDKAEAYALAKKLTAPSGFQRFLAFVDAAASIVGAVKAGITAVRSLTTALSKLGEPVTESRGIAGRATDIIRSPRKLDEAKRLGDAAKGAKDLGSAGSAAGAGAKAAKDAAKPPGPPPDVAKDWMAANSKAITALGAAQAQLNAMGFKVQEIGLLEKLSEASRPIAQVAELMTAHGKEGKRLGPKFSARLDSAASTLEKAFAALEPRLDRARTNGQALAGGRPTRDSWTSPRGRGSERQGCVPSSSCSSREARWAA